MIDWQPIGTGPTEPRDDPPQVMLWVEGGGGFRKGCAAFGHCYESHNGDVKGVAGGFNGFHCSHWAPYPDPPK